LLVVFAIVAVLVAVQAANGLKALKRQRAGR
jgi:Tfp pilus assembly protein FimT